MTTPAVIPLTHCVDMALIARLFARFRGRYGNLWTSRANHDDDWEFIMEDWLQELSKFSFEHVRSAINKTLTEFKEYPPTLGQLVELCMKESGIPNQQDIIRAMVARDFSHPLVKMMYDKVGSWTLTNGKTEEIERKVKEHYASLRAEFHVEPQKAWCLLEEYNGKPKELPPPPKIPKDNEMKAFRDCISKCKEILKGKKIEIDRNFCKQFEEKKVTSGHKDFESATFEEYRRHLMSIPETETMKLPPTALLDRNKFLNMRDQKEFLRKLGYVPHEERDGFDSPKGSNRSGAGKPVKVYKNWADA